MAGEGGGRGFRPRRTFTKENYGMTSLASVLVVIILLAIFSVGSCLFDLLKRLK